MVFKDGNISKILKMFKFLKFYFVSFVVLLFESNYKQFGVGKILGKSVVYFVVFKKDVEFKKEQELKRKVYCKDFSLVNLMLKREKKDDGRYG